MTGRATSGREFRPDVQRLLEAFCSTAAIGFDNDRGSGGDGALICRTTLDG